MLDVAAAGGWKELESLRQCYQQADEATMLEVATGGTAARRHGGKAGMAVRLTSRRLGVAVVETEHRVSGHAWPVKSRDRGGVRDGNDLPPFRPTALPPVAFCGARKIAARG